MAIANRGDEVIWSGTPVPGTSVGRLIHIGSDEDAVVLLDHEVRPNGVLPHHPFDNLLRLRPDGSIVWRAGPPLSDAWRCFVAAKTSGGSLFASGASHRYTISIETGEVLDSLFTK